MKCFYNYLFVGLVAISALYLIGQVKVTSVDYKAGVNVMCKDLCKENYRRPW